MSKFKATVTYTIESDDLSAEDITAHFDNEADENNLIEVEVQDSDDNDLGTMTITEADATVEVTEF